MFDVNIEISVVKQLLNIDRQDAQSLLKEKKNNLVCCHAKLYEGIVDMPQSIKFLITVHSTVFKELQDAEVIIQSV